MALHDEPTAAQAPPLRRGLLRCVRSVHPRWWLRWWAADTSKGSETSPPWPHPRVENGDVSLSEIGARRLQTSNNDVLWVPAGVPAPAADQIRTAGHATALDQTREERPRARLEVQPLDVAALKRTRARFAPQLHVLDGQRQTSAAPRRGLVQQRQRKRTATSSRHQGRSSGTSWIRPRPVRRLTPTAGGWATATAKWDGLFPIELPRPDELAMLAAEVGALRHGNTEPFDFVIEVSPGEDLGPWEAAGATWVLNGFGPEPREVQVHAQIEAGPD